MPSALPTRLDHQLFLACQDVNRPGALNRVLGLLEAGADPLQAFPLAMDLVLGRTRGTQVISLSSLELLLATWPNAPLAKCLRALERPGLGEAVFPGLSALRQFRFEYVADVAPIIARLRDWNSNSPVFRGAAPSCGFSMGLWEVVALRHHPADTYPGRAQAFELIQALERCGLDWTPDGPGPAALVAAVCNTKYGPLGPVAPDLLAALLLSAPASWWELPAKPLLEGLEPTRNFENDLLLGDYLVGALGAYGPSQFPERVRAQRQQQALSGALPAGSAPGPRKPL